MPDRLIGDLQEVADGVWLLPGFGNTTIIIGSGGATVVDPGPSINGPRVDEARRSGVTTFQRSSGTATWRNARPP